MTCPSLGMSNYTRPKIPGASIFFTVNLADRSSTLLVDQIDALRDAVRTTKSERPFHSDAWVVLPNHMHMVWTLPAGDSDYSTRIGAIKARFTRGLGRVGFYPTNVPKKVGYKPTLQRTASKIRKGDAGIWQRRFWEHHIRNETEYRAYVDYCHINPVKHGLVERPEEWPYSTVHVHGV
ncbi:transposase [Cognatishimia sp. WU-CL00825]|uniref:REP-associated tyrosine transposase n=1 Tax=Cognatishimia sp. WU-CL00825 TaxID=3127658 RepID=UPI00310C2BD8